MKNVITVIVIAGIFTGCAINKPIPYQVQAAYDKKLTEEMLQPGKGKIQGQAFLRRNDGVVVTCAGSNVFLSPETPYSAERVWRIYGSDLGGAQSLFAPQYEFSGDDGSYKSMQKLSICDANGNFKFDLIRDGSFYIQTVVHWGASGNTQGAFLAKKVTVSNGKTVDVVITQ